MSALELNKIIASILLASLIAMLAGFFAKIIYRPIPVETRGFSVATTETDNKTPANTTEAAKPVNIAELMSKANVEAGKNIAKKCQMCHSLEENGPNRLGPHLWGIFGDKKARLSNFSYSSAMTKEGGIWDEESLFHFLHKPSQFIPGTKMTFVGLSNPQDIADVISYLKTLHN